MSIADKQFDIPEKFKADGVVDVLGDQQVLKLITKAGDSSPERATAGCTAILHYTGTLTNGNKFDSSRDRGEPFETPVAQGRVIRGWDAVMPTMAKGERCEVLIQSEFAYGAQGSPPNIPGGAVLIFDMEMIDWFGEDVSEAKDKSLTKLKIKSSEEFKSVEAQDLDEIVVSLEVDGEVKSEKLAYIAGEESLHEHLNATVTHCIKSMVVGEKSSFTAKRNSNYNKSGSDVKYVIEILEYKAAKRSYEMDADERIAVATLAKQAGTDFFKEAKYEVAESKYNYVLKLIEDKTEEAEALRFGCLQNLALISLKMKNYYQTVPRCDAVLEIEPKNEKALFRKAEAQYHMKEYALAIKTYKIVIDINPDNKAAKRGQINSQKLLKAWQEAEKKKYSKMFG